MENYEEGTYNEPQQQQQSPAVAAAASQSELSFENAYTVLRPGEILKKLSKRQGALLKDLKTYLLDEYMTEREKLQELGSEEGLLAENLLKLREKLAKLVENPQRWERVHQLLSNINNDLYYSRQSVDARKRLVQISNPYMRESMSTLTTPMPSSASSNRPTRKPRKKKKKKKPRHWVNSRTTSTAITTTTEVTSTPQPLAVLALATTEMPWPTTHTPGAMTWRLFAEKLFRSTWNQEELGVDDSNVAKMRYSIPSKPRTIASMRRPLDDKERESLKALNSERRALMLKAAREYSQPRLLHFGKINTHQQTSSDEDLEDGFDSNQRSYQRTHFGQLVSPSSTRLDSGFPRPREHPLSYPEQQQQLQQSPPQFDVNFARNQEYLPPGREFAASKPWQGGGSSFHYDKPWSELGETNGPAPISSSEGSWNWRQFSNPPVPAVPKPWLPWHTERDYFARLEEKEEETTKARKQAQQRQQQRNRNRQNMREMVPPWQEEKDVRRVHQTPKSWLKPEKSRKYGLQRDQHSASWDNSRNNNSELKHTGQSQSEDDSKESPKLTMKTWNSLTSDPATWPFQLPGAKPWPKDANGKSYNPNAELVRKLGLYKNGRLRPEKDALKDLKQHKLQKTEKQGELVQPDDTRPIPWGGKVAPIPSKINNWIEPNEQQTWYNNMKLHENYEDVDSSPNDRSNHWSNEGQSSQSNNARMWSREKLPDEWNLAKAATSSHTWPAKWKQFAYHKVMAQPTSKSGVTLDKPNKNAYIAVSAVSSPRYGNEWRKNDLEDIGPLSNSGPITEDPDHPASQLRMSVWKKSSGVNETMNAIDKAARIDVLENQLEDLKKNEGPVLLEVNVTIRNSTSNQTLTSAPSILLTVNGSPKDIENKNKEKMTSKKNQQTSN